MNALQIIGYAILSFVLVYMIVFILVTLIIYFRYFFWKVRLKRRYKKIEKLLKQLNESMPLELKKAIIYFEYFKELSEDDRKLAYKAAQQILQSSKLEKEDSNNDNTSTTNTEPK